MLLHFCAPHCARGRSFRYPAAKNADTAAFSLRGFKSIQSKTKRKEDAPTDTLFAFGRGDRVFRSICC